MALTTLSYGGRTLESAVYVRCEVSENVILKVVGGACGICLPCQLSRRTGSRPQVPSAGRRSKGLIIVLLKNSRSSGLASELR